MRTRWPKRLHRGLLEYGSFIDSYGATVRVQTSSSAEGPHAWLYIEGSTDPNYRAKNNGAAHLTRRQAKYLRAALDRWLPR